MTTTITPEALERAVELALTAIRKEEKHILGEYKTPDNGARRRTIKAGILAALPELLAAQPQLNTQEARPLTDEKGRPVTYWGGKAAQPASSAGGQPVAWHIEHPDGLVALRKRDSVDKHMVAQAAADGVVIRPLVFGDAAPVAGEAAEMSPEFTDTARAAIAWVLWHHQGGSSAVGQPLRYALGMGDHEPLNDRQIAEAKRYASLVGAKTEDFKRPAPAAVSGEMPGELRWLVDTFNKPFTGLVRLNSEEWAYVRAAIVQPAAQGVDLGAVERAMLAHAGKHVTSYVMAELRALDSQHQQQESGA